MKNNCIEYVKANAHGEWLANNEFEKGFKSTHKVHKSKKNYIRKPKFKIDYV